MYFVEVLFACKCGIFVLNACTCFCITLLHSNQNSWFLALRGFTKIGFLVEFWDFCVRVVV